jgi:hypothetical protein
MTVMTMMHRSGLLAMALLLLLAMPLALALIPRAMRLVVGTVA